MNERSYETLLYSITASVVSKIMGMNGWVEDEAFERFTASRIYSYLEKEETKVWQYSSEMMLELFDRELHGNLEFPEV